MNSALERRIDRSVAEEQETEVPTKLTKPRAIEAAIDELLTLQRTVPFTTAHNRAYGRRQHAETVNSRLKGGSSSLTNIAKGYTLLMNTAKIGVFLAHTISRLNQDEYTNHVRNRQALEEQDSVQRKPRSDAVKRSSDLEKKQPENTSDP